MKFGTQGHEMESRDSLRQLEELVTKTLNTITNIFISFFRIYNGIVLEIQVAKRFLLWRRSKEDTTVIRSLTNKFYVKNYFIIFV